MNAAQLASAKRALSRQPLDQALLNAVFVSDVRNGTTDLQRQAYVNALARMGWRHTPTQQNLLFEAAQRNDLQSALDHMDALLRRNQLDEQIMLLLSQLEADSVGRKLMAERLASDPGWRTRYFEFADPLANPEILEARLLLFDFMATKDMPVDPIEKRATAAALFNAGRREDVANLARGLMSADRQDRLLFDPEFDQWLGYNINRRWETMPQDWRLTNRPGVTSQIVSEEWSSRLVLRWDGRGAPVMARTMTFLKQGEKPRLEVSLSAGSELRGLDSLRFSLICTGIREVVFVRRPGWSAEHPGMDRRISVYEAEDASACNYPELFIGGRPQIGDRGANLSIDSIELTLP